MSRPRNRCTERGFSLVEMTMAFAIFIFAALAAYALYAAGTRSFRKAENATDLQQNARTGFDQMVRELRLAGFNTNADGTPTRPDEQIEGAWDTAVSIRADFDFEDVSRNTSPESALAGTFNIVTTGNDEIVTFALAKPTPTAGSAFGFVADVGDATRNGTDEAVALVGELYDRARLRSAGHITYAKDLWPIATGAKPWPDGDDEKRRNAWKVVWSDDDGQVQGAAIYTVDDRWEQNRPAGTLQATHMVTATDEAERELARYMTTVDWVTRVRLHLRPVDDPTPLWLHDGRRANLVDRSDHLWARILDVPAALTARTYGFSGRLVLEVDDPFGFAAGRFALDASPSGASCVPTTDSPDLALPVGALSAAYLGGLTVSRLAAAGSVDERTPGAVAAATALFTAPRAPWCAMTF